MYDFPPHVQTEYYVPFVWVENVFSKSNCRVFLIGKC